MRSSVCFSINQIPSFMGLKFYRCRARLIKIVRLKKVLALAPLPPPYSGPEISSEILFSRPFDRVKVDLLNISVKKGKSDRGFLTPGALARYGLVYSKYLSRLIFGGPEGIYLPITATRLGWMRDLSILYPAHLLRKKTILHMRGGHFHFFYKALDESFRKRVRDALERASAIIVQSPSLMKQFDGIVPRRKLKVLPNPYHPDFEHMELRRDKVRILFVGLFSVAKGYHDLVEVAQEILDAGMDVEFVFLGTPIKGERNIFYNQLTGEPIPWKPFIRLEDERVRYVESAYGRDKIRLYEECSIFVLPSYSEGFSMAVLEGMVSACAVITTKVGAMVDIIEHGKTGVLIDPGDRKSLKEWLVRLIEDEGLRKEMGTRARQYAMAHFSPERVRRQLEDIFLEALSQS